MNINNKPLVWIIIPTWNRFKDLYDCLQSIESQTYENYKIVIVDNGSEDDTLNKIKELYPTIKLIELGENFGASYASNQGLNYAMSEDGDLFFRLDSDTILESNYLEILVKFLENTQNAGIVSGLMLSFFQPEQILVPGWEFSKWNLSPKHLTSSESFTLDSVDPIEVQLLPSTGMVITRQTLEKIKGFDEDYLVYYEDFDFCLRAIKSGFKLFVIPRARIRHKVFSQNKTAWIAYQWNRSKMIFYRKHAHNYFHRVFMVLYAITYAIFRSIIKVDDRGNKGPIGPAFKGLIDGLFSQLA